MRIALDIPPGLISDDTAFATEGAWRDGDKVRFWRGRPQVIGGWEKYFISPLQGICRTILAWTDTAGILNSAYGQAEALELGYGGAIYDITPVAFVPGNVDGTGGAGYGTGEYGAGAYGDPSVNDTFPLTWSLSTYGQSLMANPRGQTIFWWQNNLATPAAPLTNAPAKVTYALVTNTRQVLAFGCNEEVSGNFNPLCIRGSDIEDPTDWTSLPANSAFEVVLEGGGRIVAARLIGNYIYVWTDHSLFLGTFVGNAAQVWSFQRVGDHCGLIGPNAAVVVNQQAYWMSTDGQFRTVSMGGEPVIIASPVAQSVKDSLPANQVDKVVASTCSQYGEVRWDYPGIGDNDGRGATFLDAPGGILGADEETWIEALPAQQASLENSRYVAVSIIDGAWCRGHMARTAYIDAGPNEYPLACDPDGNVWLHERGFSADGGAFDWYLESADQYFDQASPMLMLRGMWPDFQDQKGPINMSVFTRNYPQANQYTAGPFSLSPAQNQRSFRASGRVVKVRLAGNSAPTYARFGKIVFDAVPTGLQ